jgi:DNA-binding MarR family transcriptional regulator
MPALPAPDALEERMLALFAMAWDAGRQIPVTEAARMEADTPERTAFRRIKSLRDKGWVTIEPSPNDHRVKFVVPTRQTLQYFESLNRCLQQALESP